MRPIASPRPGRTRPAHPTRDRLHALERGVAGELDRLRGSRRRRGREDGLHARADRVIERVKRLR